MRWWITKHWDQQTFEFFASTLQSLCCWVHSKLGLQPLPERVISVHFPFTFFQRCYQSSFPKGSRAISKAKGRLSVSKAGLPSAEGSRNNQEDSALYWVSVFEEKPEKALRTWKQPARLAHLNKKSCSLPETGRQARHCGAKGGHSSGTSSWNWEKWH